MKAHRGIVVAAMLKRGQRHDCHGRERAGVAVLLPHCSEKVKPGAAATAHHEWKEVSELRRAHHEPVKIDAASADSVRKLVIWCVRAGVHKANAT